VVLLLVPSAAWAQGDPIGPEFRVNTYTTSFQALQAKQSVAADASGNFVVVWASYMQDGSNWGVFGQRYANTGAPLGGEFRVNTYTTGAQAWPSVAADSAGNFVIVWQGNTQDGSAYGVFGQRYASAGDALGPEFRVNTFTTFAQGYPSLATDPAGNFIVVWEGNVQDGSADGVFGQRYASSGTPLGPEFRVNSYTTTIQNEASVAADANGNFVVVWRSYVQDGSVWGVFGQRYASTGAPVGGEFRVNTYTTGDQVWPSVAADSAGNFVVAWHSNIQDGSSAGVFGQRYASTGGALAAEFRVNSYTTDNQVVPEVAADPSGNFVVVWTSFLQDASVAGVFGQRYASTGAPLGPEFRVNTYTTDRQLIPSVVVEPSGKFVVVWNSYLQDGSADGVFAQRYSMIVPVELMHFGIE